MSRFIPLSIPNFEGNERKYVDDAINQGWVSTGGAYISKLEEEMALFLHSEEVVACQSGTSAIHLALIDAGVGCGDVVIVPALTFIAAVNPVKYQSAIPIFMDCDDSLCIDPIKLKDFCENECQFDGEKLAWRGKIVKAIILVHVFGNMADMESFLEVSKKYNIIIIEDATEALGTFYSEGKLVGKYAGTIGDYGAFSFNGNKIITTGGGGAITAKDTSKVNHIRYLSTQAKDDARYYVHNEVGYNYRMTNLQAALGVAQLEKLSEFVVRKNNNYKLYNSYFEDFELAHILPFRNGVYSNKWFYSLMLDIARINVSIKDIVCELESRGIQTRTIWGLVNEQLPYKDDYSYKIEKATYYVERIINIPCSTNISKEDIEYVANQIMIVLKGMIDG